MGFIAKVFDNPAAASAGQDYIWINVMVLPLLTIVDGYRRGPRQAVAVLRIDALHQLRVRPVPPPVRRRADARHGRWREYGNIVRQSLGVT
jgi:hypothetical protein